MAQTHAHPGTPQEANKREGAGIGGLTPMEAPQDTRSNPANPVADDLMTPTSPDRQSNEPTPVYRASLEDAARRGRERDQALGKIAGEQSNEPQRARGSHEPVTPESIQDRLDALDEKVDRLITRFL